MKLNESINLLWCCCWSLYAVVSALPVSQSSYSGTQYVNAQLPPNYPAQQQTYLQQIAPQPQYITANVLQQAPSPIYNDAQRSPQQFLPQTPTQKVPQLILPSNVDRQVTC